jgi:hypothetical protein
MWNVKQSGLRARLHREIIERDYHLSAAMYMQPRAGSVLLDFRQQRRVTTGSPSLKPVS